MKLVGLAASLVSPQQNNKIHITVVVVITVVIQLSRATACVKHWGGKTELTEPPVLVVAKLSFQPGQWAFLPGMSISIVKSHQNDGAYLEACS